MINHLIHLSDQVMKTLLEMRDAAKAASKDKSEESASSTTDPGRDSSPSPTSPDESPAPHLQAPPVNNARQTVSETAQDATRLLLNKYMKKMKLGDIEVQIRENQKWNQEAESLLQIIEGPDKNKHVSVQLDNLVTSETEQKISKVYDELVKLLMSHTNLHSLADRSSYLKALADLVETAFTRGESGLDDQAQATLDRLAAELRPKTKAEESEATPASTASEDLIKAVEGEDIRKQPPTDARRFYLVDNNNNIDRSEEVKSRSTIVKKAPEWMGLQDGEVMLDENGVMYVNDGYDFDDDSMSSSLDDLVKPDAARGHFMNIKSSSAESEEIPSSQNQENLVQDTETLGGSSRTSPESLDNEGVQGDEVIESSVRDNQNNVAPKENRDSESTKDEL